MTQTASSRRRRAWLLATSVVVLLAVLVGTYWLMTDGPGAGLLSPAGSTVDEFSATGNVTTNSFRVRQGWSIHWESMSDSFGLAIRGDRDFGTVISLDEPGSGVTSPTGAGTFHLEVTAEGAWTIEVVQGD